MVGDLGPLFARKRSLKEKEIYGELVLKLFLKRITHCSMMFVECLVL